MKRKIEFKWAMIFIGMMLFWMILERVSGLHDSNIEYHSIVTNFIAIPSILIYYFAVRDKKINYYGGSISYGQAFLTGLVMTLIITLFSPFLQYATSVWISPDYFNNITNYTIENNMMSEKDAKNYFNLNSYMMQTIVFTPIMGIMTTLVVSIFLFTRKSKINLQ